MARRDLLALDHFLAWLQRFYTGLYRYEVRMGQTVFVCGPRNNGKTLLCLRIVGALVGDRTTSPYDYFTGKTDFNAELFECALWAMNDEESPNEERKNILQAKLKSTTVNPLHTFHPKYCKKLTLPWTGRIFITLNDDPASIGVLPEVNENTADKLMFFASQEYGKAFLSNHETEAIIQKELPFLARWLLDIYKPPTAVLAPGRMGVKSFFDPKILELSKQQFRFYNLRELLGVWAPAAPEFNSRNEWTGTPSALMASMANLTGLAPLLKDWNVEKIANSLTALARIGGTGVHSVNGSTERQFRIDRSELQPERATALSVTGSVTLK